MELEEGTVNVYTHKDVSEKKEEYWKMMEERGRMNEGDWEDIDTRSKEAERLSLPCLGAGSCEGHDPERYRAYAARVFTSNQV